MGDIRYALRTLRATLIVSVTAGGTIALALGLMGVAFMVFNVVVLRAETIHKPRELYSVEWMSRAKGVHGFTFREAADIREGAAEIFTDVAARKVNAGARLEGHLASGQLVSGNFFTVLGTRPALGRLIEPADSDITGRGCALVLSHLARKRFFNSDPLVISRSVPLSAHSCVVVGVTPEGFHGLTPTPADFYVHLMMVREMTIVQGNAHGHPGR